MTSTATNYNQDGIRKIIEAVFADKFPTVKKGSKTIFVLNGSETASIVPLKIGTGETFFVIEYGSGEDGESFYPSDYQSIEEMAAEMLKEAEG